MSRMSLLPAFPRSTMNAIGDVHGFTVQFAGGSYMDAQFDGAARPGDCVTRVHTFRSTHQLIERAINLSWENSVPCHAR